MLRTKPTKDAISWGITNWLANKARVRLPEGDKQKGSIQKVIEEYSVHVGLKGYSREEMEGYISKNWPRFTYWVRTTYKKY